MIMPCPFCNGLNLGIGRLTEDREGYPTYIYCTDCGCQGPWIYLHYMPDVIEVACKLTGWNKRSK